MALAFHACIFHESGNRISQGGPRRLATASTRCPVLGGCSAGLCKQEARARDWGLGRGLIRAAWKPAA
jgi:hypothetical protein